MIQIAVLGYGTVGSGVVEVINRNQESINKKAGEDPMTLRQSTGFPWKRCFPVVFIPQGRSSSSSFIGMRS